MTYCYSYIFVTDLNEAYVHFHSDYSVSSSGFHLQWNTVDMSGCPSQTLSALEGQVVSPNYPNFILPNLNCVTMILAPGEGRRLLNHLVLKHYIIIAPPVTLDCCVNMHFWILQSATVYGSISSTTTWTNHKRSSCICRELRTI